MSGTGRQHDANQIPGAGSPPRDRRRGLGRSSCDAEETQRASRSFRHSAAHALELSLHAPLWQISTYKWSVDIFDYCTMLTGARKGCTDPHQNQTCVGKKLQTGCPEVDVTDVASGRWNESNTRTPVLTFCLPMTESSNARCELKTVRWLHSGPNTSSTSTSCRPSPPALQRLTLVSPRKCSR